MSAFTSEHGRITLIGTVHASHRSRDDVIDAVAEVTPDVVAVELDTPRYRAMVSPKNHSQSPGYGDFVRSVLSDDFSARGAVIKHLFVFHQSRILEASGLLPGEADMLPAIEAGASHGADVALVDGNVQDVMNGVGESFSPPTLVSHFRRVGLLSAYANYQSLLAISERNGLDDVASLEGAVRKIEQMSESDLCELLDAYETLLPAGVLDPLIFRRNEQMAGHLHWLQQEEKSVVAVMGRMHLPGVGELLESPEQIPAEYIVEPPYVQRPAESPEG